MTREEAVTVLKGAIKKPNTKDGYLGQAIDMAIKSLEQESVLDKIKENIKRLKHQNTDMVGYRWWNNAIENCLHEIDYCIAESEDEGE